MSAPNPRLLEWMRKRRTDLTEDGLIQRVELWHTVDGEGGVRLEVVNLAERDEDEDIDEVTIELWAAAEEDASTRPQGSHQRYTVMLYRGEDEREAEEAKSFTIQGSMLSHLLGGNTDSPTERGIIGQDLRQRNEMHALMLRSMEGIAGGLERQLRVEREWSTQLESQRRQYLITEQQMLDRSSERDLERQKAQKSEERLDMVVNVITGLAPMILSKLFEKPASPAPATSSAPSSGTPPASGGGGGGIPQPLVANYHRIAARDTAVSNVLGTLTPDQLQTLAKVMRPDQAMTFLEIYSSYKDEQEAVAKTQGNGAVKPPPPANRTGSNDFSIGEEIHGSEETH